MPFANEMILAGGYLLLALGLVGSVVPVIPGPLIIWLGAFLWAMGDNFETLGWPMLILLGLMALTAWGADLLFSTVLSRRAGASWKSIGGAIVGGIIGGILLGGSPPILGSLMGAFLGAMVGMYLVEFYDKRNRRAATVAIRAYLASMVLGAATEFAIALGMVGLFAWRVL
jgi:uncharacterized protein YqgC (DUF456 family)